MKARNIQVFVVLCILINASYSLEATTYMYILAQEWVGSVCNVEPSCPYMGKYDGQRWNIHGLWPNTQLTSSCGSIQYCRTDPYDSSKIQQNTKDVLNLVWNGLYSDTEAFRGYEWEKHGTCYPGEVSQNYFFQTAAGLAQKYNYYSILAKSEIYPDDSRPLVESDIRNAFAAVLGSSAKITFSCFKHQVTGKFFLGQLKVCFDEQLQIRTCNCKLNGEDEEIEEKENYSQFSAQPLVSCGSVFYYPEL
ncbi:unnamed protein product (macronuclear) [Paramecium tetraurelia]|uniref:Uncharacterized protein n=1 Tax=Paramecium tetraurelia TaxID=5888 RepID=A0D7A0_PARTE|nr:uncharacterized protein GSPATT00001959001 [Paramecium tetraurelia]CAK78917.1 unnamed protein product [Paramecium tetraurelia]|eukprot:XP_001446314.1 hypothetical protein (macronuclear) [Paramecium tetraurelia strain d4-2]